MTFLFLIGKSDEVRALPFVFYNHKKSRTVSDVESAMFKNRPAPPDSHLIA